MKDHRINRSLIIPILLRDNANIRRPKIIPIPIATPVRDTMGIPAAKYFMPNRILTIHKYKWFGPKPIFNAETNNEQ